ncbi:hypothetical protein XHV734_1942 [Xanthomonas hortorum pv. vitians]|nr:hypothetical protein XHV734_1942 [Xanthomonas hortorum pv. vitians]
MINAPLPLGVRKHGLRVTGAHALERPRRKRWPGRAAERGRVRTGIGRSHRLPVDDSPLLARGDAFAMADS